MSRPVVAFSGGKKRPKIALKRKVCARCLKRRLIRMFKTRSGRDTDVCKDCRDKHKKKVKLSGETTSLSAKSMTDQVECEACGQVMAIKDMLKHIRTHNHDLWNIPGAKPPGEIAE